MKQLLFLLFLMLPGFGLAQDLTFKGVPISGTLEEFEKQLTQKGVFKGMEKDPNVAGKYYSDSICLVINYDYRTRTVGSVSIDYNPESIENPKEYLANMKRDFTAKYGEATVTNDEETTWYYWYVKSGNKTIGKISLYGPSPNIGVSYEDK